MNSLKFFKCVSRFGSVWVVIFLMSQPSTLANVVGADTQNFNPTTSGLDFVTVQSSETLRPGILNMGVFLNFAVNSLPNYENQLTQDRTNFADSLLSSDLNFGLGILNNWDFGVSMPVLLSQTVQSDIEASRGEFASNGITEFRFNTKFRLWGNQDRGIALVGTANLNQIEDNPFSGQDAGPTFTIEAAADTTINRFAVGVNGGFRARSPGTPLPDIPVQPLGNQVIASVAASYLIGSYDTKIITEVFGSIPVESSEFASDRDLSTAEFLLGLKTDFTTNLAFHVGGGTKILNGVSSPDWRVYSGLNWAIGPLYGKPPQVIERNIDPTEIQDIANDIMGPFESDPPPVRELFVARDVLFEFNSDQVTVEFRDSIMNLKDYLLRPPEFRRLVIFGHTDSVGDDAYNLELSRRRAEAVKQVMVRLGLPRDRIRAVGKGESEPVADNGNYQGRALNRRVEFDIYR